MSLANGPSWCLHNGAGFSCKPRLASQHATTARVGGATRATYTRRAHQRARIARSPARDEGPCALKAVLRRLSGVRVRYGEPLQRSGELLFGYGPGRDSDHGLVQHAFGVVDFPSIEAKEHKCSIACGPLVPSMNG